MANADEKQYFDNAREMFLTAGWSDFMRMLRSIVETLLLDALTMLMTSFCKGKLAVFRVFAVFETTVKEAERLNDIDD